MEPMLCGRPTASAIIARKLVPVLQYKDKLESLSYITEHRLLPGTIRYDSVYLTCSKKLTSSQLSPPNGTNKKLKCDTKNKTMSMVRSSPVVMKAVR